MSESESEGEVYVCAGVRTRLEHRVRPLPAIVRDPHVIGGARCVPPDEDHNLRAHRVYDGVHAVSEALVPGCVRPRLRGRGVGRTFNGA